MSSLKELVNLNKMGYFLIKDFASTEECDDILKTLDGNHKNSINDNELNVTKLNSTLFNKHAIAISKSAFDIVTSSLILDISKNLCSNFDLCVKMHKLLLTHILSLTCPF